MTRVRPTALLAIAVLVGLASSCTSVSSGDPRAADSTSTHASTDETTEAPPTRPREITLDDVDPCTLLQQTEYQDYGLNKPGKPTTDSQGAAACLWLAASGHMGVSLVTQEGVDSLSGRYSQVESASAIDDFPAYAITLPGEEETCFMAIDVAEGQYLKIQASVDSSALTDIPPICDYAHDFATSIMSTLVNQ